MIVLIPVSRFRVPYEIARGRPYSKLERRVLEAIAAGGATLRNLSAAFHVHERLLVESVVTLVNAGWVAVAGGAEATFVLTAEGNAAVDAGQDPVSVLVSQAKPHTVILERVAGQLARHADARSYHRDDLAEVWQSAARVAPRIFRNVLDEAQVQKLLPRGPGEWIRWVGPITLASKDRHFLPIDVNQETGQTRGLPPSWHEPLISHVLAAAQGRTAQDEHDATSADRQGVAAERTPTRTPPAPRRPVRFVSVPDTAGLEPSQATTVSLDPDDVFVGTDAHNSALSTALSSASRNMLIVSPSVDAARLTEFLAESADAVRRRVRVDILPGTTPHGLDQAGVLAAVNRAGYQTAGNDGRSLLRTGTQPTGSGASLLLYDDNSGHLVAVIGDHDWLGPPVIVTPVSVRLTQPTIVSTLARAAASLWTSAQPGGDPGAADRWRRLASETEERGAVEELRAGASDSRVQTSIEVIVDDEHVAVRAEHQGAEWVGRFYGGPDDGPGTPKGISVQLIGPGAALITAARASM